MNEIDVSLRDWFAAQALAGICAACMANSVRVVKKEGVQVVDMSSSPKETAEMYATTAYALADAMLAVR